MIELPESYTIAGQMRKTLVGKKIARLQVLQTPHKFAFFHGDADRYEELLEGQEIEGAEYHGGMVQMNLKDCILVFADGAYPRYYEDRKKFPKRHQLAIYFEDETAMFVSIQMYGIFFLYPKGQCEDGYYVSSCTKPDPLGDQENSETDVRAGWSRYRKRSVWK